MILPFILLLTGHKMKFSALNLTAAGPARATHVGQSPIPGPTPSPTPDPLPATIGDGLQGIADTVEGTVAGALLGAIFVPIFVVGLGAPWWASLLTVVPGFFAGAIVGSLIGASLAPSPATAALPAGPSA